MAAACGLTASIATGYSNAGLNSWYLCMLLHKEGWSRLGFFGYDLQDQCGSSNSLAVRPDEGAVGEFLFSLPSGVGPIMLVKRWITLHSWALTVRYYLIP